MPLAAGAETGGRLRGAGQVSAVRFISHSSVGISAADVTLSLPFTAGHRALDHSGEGKQSWDKYLTYVELATAYCAFTTKLISYECFVY